MAGARNYQRFLVGSVLSEVDLQRRVLDFGAGTGLYAKALRAERSIRDLCGTARRPSGGVLNARASLKWPRAWNRARKGGAPARVDSLNVET